MSSVIIDGEFAFRGGNTGGKKLLKKLKLKKTIYVKTEKKGKAIAMDERAGMYFICVDMAADVLQLLFDETPGGGITQQELRNRLLCGGSREKKRDKDRFDQAIEEIINTGILVARENKRRTSGLITKSRIDRASRLAMVSALGILCMSDATMADCVRSAAHDGHRWGLVKGDYDIMNLFSGDYDQCSLFAPPFTPAACSSCGAGLYVDNNYDCPCIWS